MRKVISCFLQKVMADLYSESEAKPGRGFG
jgi:hypothetical protein